MFHIVFNANESYIKYLAVLCYSIVAHTNLRKNENQEGYHFHILTDGLTFQTQEKIKQFQAQLAEIYPCNIDVYFLGDEDFEGLPKLNGNYLTYFRLKIANVLPQEIQKCLYLDVDMLCLSDIREIFSIDLGGKICAAVKDADYRTSRIMKPKNESRGGG